METARKTERFERQAPPLAPQDASFVDALLAMPSSLPADPVDRASVHRIEIELARRLKAVIERQR